MKTPHKHAELIKAWADGAEIEFLIDGDWFNSPSPAWSECLEYRIKPEPKPDVVYYGVFDEDVGRMRIDSCFTRLVGRGDQIKITFDGETGKLKSAEVLNDKP